MSVVVSVWPLPDPDEDAVGVGETQIFVMSEKDYEKWVDEIFDPRREWPT